MQHKLCLFKRLQLSTFVGIAAVAALDSALVSDATLAPPSFSNVAVADETSPRAYEDKRRDAQIGSILSLLDVPEGESGAFYRERLQELQNACAGVVSFEAACYNLVKYSDEKGLPQWRRAEPNSLENRIYVVARDLYERLFDAPDLEPQIRDRYFDEYLRESYLLYGDASDEVARQNWRDFCVERLALEETREPFPLARVLALHNEIERADARVEKLADCPRLVAFIDDLLADANLDSIESLESLGEILARLRAQERPAEEDVAFYRERWQELRSLVSPRGIQINVYTLLVGPFLAEKLAFAEELDPIERFEAFQIYVGSVSADVLNGPNDRRARVERLTALLEEETKRKAEHPADAARVPYLRERLFHARYGVFLKPIGEQETTPLSEEDRAELERFAADALELVDDGPLPWSFRRTWGSTVCVFIRDFADQIDVKFATQLRKDVLARLRNSANETDRALCAEMAAAVRDAEIIGSTPTVALSPTANRSTGRLIAARRFWSKFSATNRDASSLGETVRRLKAKRSSTIASTRACKLSDTAPQVSKTRAAITKRLARNSRNIIERFTSTGRAPSSGRSKGAKATPIGRFDSAFRPSPSALGFFSTPTVASSRSRRVRT